MDRSKGVRSDTLAFFDLQRRSLMWQIAPVTGWAESYEFDVSRQELAVVCGELGRFRYSFSGEFLDGDRLKNAEIEKADMYAVVSMARDEFEKLRANASLEEARHIFELLDIALSKPTAWPAEKAYAIRWRGEVYEKM